LHIGWGLCDRLCLVLVCRGRYGLGRVFLLFILESNLGGGGPVMVFGGDEEGGCVRSGPGAARTILLFHTISARPSKQPRMVGSTLGVYSFGLFFFLQEQIKDIIISSTHTLKALLQTILGIWSAPSNPCTLLWMGGLRRRLASV
jgi:hypothetical protein